MPDFLLEYRLAHSTESFSHVFKPVSDSAASAGANELLEWRATR